MSAPERVVIGNAELWHGDCREVLPLLPGFDAVITDPPYGIGSGAKYRNRGQAQGCMAKTSRESYAWDDVPPDQGSIDACIKAATWCAVFGGNYFGLPPSSCWLVWDKLNGDNDFSDCELAWTNWPKAVRRLQWRWHGMIRQGNEERFHPTQKPLQVMAWVIDLCPKSDTIIDPYMGSGTTGVAAITRGKSFTGIELERRYFDIACERISRAQAQGRLLPPEEPTQEQISLLEPEA